MFIYVQYWPRYRQKKFRTKFYSGVTYSKMLILIGSKFLERRNEASQITI